MNQTEIDELVKKLSLKNQGSSYIMHAPDDYMLPGTENLNSIDDTNDIDWIQVFYGHEDEMTKELPAIRKQTIQKRLSMGMLAKRSANKGSNLNDVVVRSVGLACGLVDVKVAAINEVWSGLKFVYRKEDR
ncbi:MAG: hypothetical protein WDN66_00370 [Candidatus Saccharibacteria bacterium]